MWGRRQWEVERQREEEKESCQKQKFVFFLPFFSFTPTLHETHMLVCVVWVCVWVRERERESACLLERGLEVWQAELLGYCCACLSQSSFSTLLIKSFKLVLLFFLEVGKLARFFSITILFDISKTCCSLSFVWNIEYPSISALFLLLRLQAATVSPGGEC